MQCIRVVVAIAGACAAAGRAVAADDLPPVQSITVGDFDGDGTPDIAVGLPAVKVGKWKEAGEVRIYSGAGGAFLRKLSGTEAEQSFGDSIAAVGDLDGDGATDLAIVAPYGEEDPYVDLVSGKPGKSIRKLRSGQSLTLMWGDEVCALGDGSGKTRVDLLVRWVQQKQWRVYHTDKGTTGGSTAAEGSYMCDAVNVGDVDGDGKADIAICDWAADVDGIERAGRVRVVSGDLLMRGRADTFVLTLKGEHEGASMGLAIASAGDWDGDGKGDLLVGTASADSKKGAWLARVVSGKDASELWRATGQPGDWHVPMVARVGDADGDGKPDVAVASGAAASEAGVVAVHSSKDGAAVWSVTGVKKENLGDELLAFPDVDADGVADLLVTAPGAALQGKKGNGYVRVLSGKTGATLLTINPLVAK